MERFGVKHRANPTVLIEVLSESTGDDNRARESRFTTIFTRTLTLDGVYADPCHA